MGFVSKDAIKKALSNGRGQRWLATKIGTLTPQGAGQLVTFYPEAGSPAAGTAAGVSWAGLTDASGTIVFSAVSPKKRYLARVAAMANQNGTLIGYDRLGHIGSISLVTSGSKTVTAVLPARYSGAETDDLNNIEALVEVTTATTSVAPIVRLNTYTNEASVGSKIGASLTFPNAVTPIGWMGRLPLAAGDKAISAIASLEVQTPTATVGACNVVLARKLFEIPVAANIPTLFAEDELDLPRVYDGSSICFMFQATAASAVQLGSVRVTTAYEE